ncbi:MAG: LysR family transcriptional regulator [Myxococcota bacterium]
MHSIDLAQIDLNLLVVFDVLLQEQHVTRAAKRLHRTQSATSHALGRLREQLGDPILVRVGGRMRPTPHALRLAPEVRRLLQAIERVLSQPTEWDPSVSERVFTLVGPDFVSATFPRLLSDMSASAPGVGVELVPPSRGMLHDVALGRYDLAVAPVDAPHVEGTSSQPLASLPWVVFARRGHPAVDRWGLDAWLQYRHIRIRTVSQGPGPVDAAVTDRKRRFGPVLPHFMLAPPLLAQSDLLLTVPFGVLADAVTPFGLVALPCPVPLEPLELALTRSLQCEQDLALTWFRNRVCDAVAQTFHQPSAWPT